MMYNVNLAIYYLLVIVYGMCDTQLQKYCGHLIVPPCIIALAGIPHHCSVDLICSIPPPPLAASWRPIIALVLFPVAFCLVSVTGKMLVIYISVRKNLTTTRKYEFNRVNYDKSSYSGAVSNILTCVENREPTLVELPETPSSRSLQCVDETRSKKEIKQKRKKLTGPN
jgi:hypothetical protein